MKKDENISTRLRNDITSLLKAIQPQFIRESALTQLLQRVVDPAEKKPQYTIGNIRAVYNSYAGRSGSVHIPHAQGVKIGASNYYVYSRFEHTEPKALKVDDETLENNAFLFIKKDTNTFFFLDGATKENMQIIETFGISAYSFADEEEDLEGDQSRVLMRVLTIQQLFNEIFTNQRKTHITEHEFIQTLYTAIEKLQTNLFQDRYKDDDTFNDDAQLELENIKECIRLVVDIDLNYQYNDDKTVIVNNNTYTPSEETNDFYLLEQQLKLGLLQIKKLQIEAIEKNDVDLILQLKPLKEIEKAITDYFNY